MSKTSPAQNLKRIWENKAHEFKFTQRQAAKKLDWSQGAISQYLNGITELSPQAIVKMANFLGVAPHDIDPDLDPGDIPQKGYWPVLGNTSGAPCTVERKLFNVTGLESGIFHVDKAIEYQSTAPNKNSFGKREIGTSYMDAGINLVVAPHEKNYQVDANADPNFPPLKPNVWLVVYKSNKPAKMFRQDEAPKAKNAKIYRVRAVLFA
tara:strand:- start:828 stop:1451 length:624 start_codon:yes stop_codon:yes gene_type:complete